MKTQDLNTFDESKAWIKKYDEVKKKNEIVVECVATINKASFSSIIMTRSIPLDYAGII